MSRIDEDLGDVFNLASYLLEGNLARGNGDKIALCDRDQTYTYSQLSNLVRRSAKLMAKLGLERENRIAILLPNQLESVVVFLGAIWLGAIPVPINPACSLAEINHILQDSRSKVLLTSHTWQEKLTPLSSEYLRHVLLVDGQQPFLSQLQDGAELTTCASTSGDEAAFWLYTSGSTGKPKGVIHAHQSALVCIKQYAEAVLGLNEEDILYSVANIAFAYGLGNSVYFPMAVGATSVLSDASNAFGMIEDIQRYQPTVFFGIPSVYARILELKDIVALDSSSLRLCVSAAEQLPKPIWNEWKEIHGLEICEGIGTTEFLHIFLSNRIGESKPGSSGRPIGGYDVEVVNESGFPCEDDQIGELQVRGESLMLGYWNQLQKTRQAIFGNMMRTGDKYKRDRNGYFWFMGRGDDLFKVNGQWISPLEIEEVLHQHQQVLEVAVVPEYQGGEKLTEIVAYISLKSSQQPSVETEKSIRQFTKQHLPHFKTPKQIYFLDKLPRTSTGKIHRQVLKKHSDSLILAP
ncbi:MULTISPECIES: benzoate-CoA ligase family protein [unclassified Nodularia (in: cyanobacteria)]|uniref:benzoate-CoA ligase family protein n=1 Tax=unclassified Nodularia (in: cyanobacteria) TaxID=2656917 RepID=UPI0018805D3F|nr:MULTISPECIES: benzoate-CoA ligase family protein [unclassified Nodularia (in: cyanobacteria)]MBE9201701.1 benzoate-CoA ligase family protein [Nodularia sp. LEGE 06071]MCC2691270.1 benzoate-CoA ligase family protein [Nodularia sp. LEGE 04288]